MGHPHMRRLMERRIIESDIRFPVDSLFREASIVIAYPQRDVHLDSASPITVRVEQAGQPSESPDE